MGRLPLLAIVIGLALVSPIAPRGVAAGEEPAALDQPSDPCGFYRGQAYGRGLDHFLTEMLWACEAIAMRRRAEMPLSDRLAAVELALERFRIALIDSGAAVFVRSSSTRANPLAPAASDIVKASLAESTGTLAALEAIQDGF